MSGPAILKVRTSVQICFRTNHHLAGGAVIKCSDRRSRSSTPGTRPECRPHPLRPAAASEDGTQDEWKQRVSATMAAGKLPPLADVAI